MNKKKPESFLARQPQRLHKIKWTDDGEKVVITATSGKTNWLNRSGAFSWKICDGKKSIKEIVDATIKEYTDIDRDTAIGIYLSFSYL